MNILIVGAGPAGLMAGYQLLKKGHAVSFFDHKKQAGRKFLVAGHGGFNLTHSQPVNEFVLNYNHQFIRDAVLKFTNEDTILWLKELEIPTFKGSSGKIFPQENIKPIEVLNALLQKMIAMGGKFYYEHSFLTFENQTVSFKVLEEIKSFHFDKLILALGGASWKKTGSDGCWTIPLIKKGIKINEFQASNAGFNILKWNSKNEGLIIKNCEVTMGDITKKGEVLFTNYGLEGAPIYAMNHFVRLGKRTITIDLKPTFSIEKLLLLFNDEKLNRTKQLEKLKIPKQLISYIKNHISKEEYLNAHFLANYLKNMPFEIESLRPIEEAISTVGGIDMDEETPIFQLINYPNIFAIGEMLDWDAPTGGYLLQACFSMGYVVAKELN